MLLRDRIYSMSRRHGDKWHCGELNCCLRGTIEIRIAGRVIARMRGNPAGTLVRRGSRAIDDAVFRRMRYLHARDYVGGWKGVV
ncbi:hypothetical protein [Burkholderia sp. PU8-34]